MRTTGQIDTPLVSLNDVTKHYRDGDVLALDSVSIDINRGEFLSIMGPSGSGKSTMLNMIGALDRPTSGSIVINGEAIDTRTNLDQIRARQIGFVFQSFYLLPNLTASENVQIPMFQTKRDAGARVAEADRLLALVGLENRKTHLPKELSNGQRQRVAIARALANEPALILADEPTGALDSQSGADTMEILSALNRDQGTTLVIVTHDPSIAERAERTVRLKDGAIES